jgi:hypothetical protein
MTRCSGRLFEAFSSTSDSYFDEVSTGVDENRGTHPNKTRRALGRVIFVGECVPLDPVTTISKLDLPPLCQVVRNVFSGSRGGDLSSPRVWATSGDNELSELSSETLVDLQFLPRSQ